MLNIFFTILIRQDHWLLKSIKKWVLYKLCRRLVS